MDLYWRVKKWFFAEKVTEVLGYVLLYYLDPFQSDFGPNYETETNLVTLVDDLMRVADRE